MSKVRTGSKPHRVQRECRYYSLTCVYQLGNRKINSIFRRAVTYEGRLDIV